MNRCPVDYAEIENDRIMNGKPRMNRADGFQLEDDELREQVKSEKLIDFVCHLLTNNDYIMDGKSFALHECLGDIDDEHIMWGHVVRKPHTTFGQIFDDDPLEAAQMVADKLLPMDCMTVIISSVNLVGKLALDIE